MKTKRVAMVGSRYMSEYGREVINKLLITHHGGQANYELRIKNLEIVTIRVSGCNSEVIRVCEKLKQKIKIFEGKNFEKLNEDVANYADLLVVIEGGRNSGTILLASKFVEKNKDVYCVPGRITNSGSWATNWLIKQGAEVFGEIDDLTGVLQ